MKNTDIKWFIAKWTVVVFILFIAGLVIGWFMGYQFAYDLAWNICLEFC